MIKFIKTFFMVLWQLPQDIVGALMYPFLGKKTLIDVVNGTRIYSGTKMSGGISLGNFIYLSERSAQRKETIAHELGHCKQSRILGWLYLIVIGLPSLCWAAFKPKEKCYYSFYTESWANHNAGLKVAKNQYGCFTYFPKKEEPEPAKKEEPVIVKEEPAKEPEKRELTLSDKMRMISRNR